MMKIRHPEKVNKPINPIKKKPNWIKSKIVFNPYFGHIIFLNFSICFISSFNCVVILYSIKKIVLYQFY